MRFDAYWIKMGMPHSEISLLEFSSKSFCSASFFGSILIEIGLNWYTPTKKNQILTAIRWFHGNFQVPKKKKKSVRCWLFSFFFFEREKAKREETFILYWKTQQKRETFKMTTEKKKMRINNKKLENTPQWSLIWSLCHIPALKVAEVLLEAPGNEGLERKTEVQSPVTSVKTKETLFSQNFI